MQDFRRAVEEADDCQAGGKLPRGFSPSYEPDDLPPQAVLVSRPSSKSSRSRSKAKPRKSDGLPVGCSLILSLQLVPTKQAHFGSVRLQLHGAPNDLQGCLIAGLPRSFTVPDVP